MATAIPTEMAKPQQLVVRDGKKLDETQLKLDGIPRLQSQDSLESFDSGSEAEAMKKPAPLLQRQLTLGSDAVEENKEQQLKQPAEADKVSGGRSISPSVPLMRQDTLLNDEELQPGLDAQAHESEPKPDSMLLQRQDTLYEDELAPAGASPVAEKKMKRELDGLQPEPLLKRQATLPLNAQSEEDEEQMQRVPSRLTSFTRMHSLMDAEDLLGKTPRNFYEEDRPGSSSRSPVGDAEGSGRFTPLSSVFSPPSGASEMGSQQMVQKVRQSPVPVAENPFSPPAVPFSPPPLTSSASINDNNPLTITRQESWKEDVSDAGWRVW